jgi:hypothetical protein
MRGVLLLAGVLASGTAQDIPTFSFPRPMTEFRVDFDLPPMKNVPPPSRVSEILDQPSWPLTSNIATRIARRMYLRVVTVIGLPAPITLNRQRPRGAIESLSGDRATACQRAHLKPRRNRTSKPDFDRLTSSSVLSVWKTATPRKKLRRSSRPGPSSKRRVRRPAILSPGAPADGRAV